MRDIIEQCLDQLSEDILALESDSPDKKLLEQVFSALGLSQLRSAQIFALFDLVRDGIAPLTPEVITCLLGLCEAHKRLLFTLAGCLDQRPAQAEAVAEAPTEAVPETGREEAAEASKPEEAKPAGETAGDHPAQAAPGRQDHPEAITSIRVGTDKLDRLIALVGKLMVTFAVISQGKGLDKIAAGGLGELDAVIGQIKTEVDAIRLVPLKQIFIPMHRLVKSLAGKTGKQVRLKLRGEDVELDKMMVEGLNEPLVHLLRNAVDHGLELPEEREAAGKDPTGTIELSASIHGGMAEVSVRDDGRGLDPARIEAKARKLGMVAPDQRPDEAEVCRLILVSGFSTSEEVTDISGRGVGMDAVAMAVRDQLRGEIDIANTPGRGCAFSLRLPLARNVNEGIVDALVVRCGGETLIIPSMLVKEVYEPGPEDMVELPGGNEVVDVRGRAHPMIRLDRFLALDNTDAPGRDRPLAVIIASGDKAAAFLVDEVLRQQQVVVTGISLPVAEIYSIPITGFGMMGESDALVVDAEKLVDLVSGRMEAAS